MNWGAILKALPALLSLAARIFGDRKKPARRAEDILGSADEPTQTAEAKAAADAAADAKYNK